MDETWGMLMWPPAERSAVSMVRASPTF